jgi:hypothetical protein
LAGLKRPAHPELAWASTGRHHAPIDFQIALVVLGYSDIRQRFPLDSGALLHCTSAVSKVARWVLGQARKGGDHIALRPAKSCPSHSVYGSHAARSDSKSVELAIPQSLLTSVGGPTPAGNRFRCPPQQRKRSRFPPPFFSASTPEYIIPDAAAAPPPATTIALDGTFTDWQAAPPAAGTVGVIVPAYLTRLQTPATGPR